MLTNFLKFFCICLALLGAQLSVFPALTDAKLGPNLVLVWVIFCAITYDLKLATLFALVLGWSLEAYSSLNFGAVIISLLAALFFTEKVFLNLFTNKSVYSLSALTLLATVVYWLSQTIFVAVYSGKISLIFPALEMYLAGNAFRFSAEMMFNLVSVITLFFFWHLSSSRYQAAYIDTTKK